MIENVGAIPMTGRDISASCCPASITSGEIDAVEQGQARAVATQILAEEAHRARPEAGRASRYVRREDHVPSVIEFALLGQGLGLEDVERGPTHPPLPQGRPHIPPP